MKKASLILVAMLILSLVVTGCSKSDPTVAVKDTLTIAMAAEPSDLDGNGKNDASSLLIRAQIYETLFAFDSEMNLAPLLTESYEWQDNKTLILHIRHGVKFHNGEEMKASDVDFSLRRALEKGFASNQLSHVNFDASVVVDDYTYKLALKYPFAPMLANLTVGATAIVNEKATKELGDEMTFKPVGTGPYTLADWKRGDQIELTKNKKYWGEAAGLKNLVFRFITESTTRGVEIETGSVDIALNIAPVDIERMEGNQSVKLVRNLNLTTDYVGFNASKKPFADVRVRQAIAHALNIPSIQEVAYMGTGIPAKGLMAPSVWGSSDDIKTLEYDPAKAKQLLAAAGYPDGFKTTIWTNDLQLRLDIAEMVQNQLKEVGIDAEIQVVEWAQYLVAVENKTLDIYILGIGASTGDADTLYSQFYSTSHFSGNTGHYKNKEADALLDATRSETDPEKRLEAIKVAHQFLVNQAPWVPVSHGETITAVRSDVMGFTNHPVGGHDFSVVTFAAPKK